MKAYKKTCCCLSLFKVRFNSKMESISAHPYYPVLIDDKGHVKLFAAILVACVYVGFP